MLNNKGWGMTAFLFIILILMVYFFIAVVRMNGLS